jgi:hypothetical protein
MTSISIGFWCAYRTPLYSPARAREMSQILTDPRWPWQPSLVRPMGRPGHAAYAWPTGKISASKLAGVIEDVMRSESAEGIHLVTSRADQGNHAWVVVENGQPEIEHGRVAYPLSAVGMCRGSVPPGQSVADWLAVVRDLVKFVDAPHAVVWVGDDERMIVSRQFLTGGYQPKLPPDHPHNESARINRVRQALGERYVRLPGWATFLARAHVDAVGGRDHLLDIVQPPVVHDVGDLLYVQLSTNVADALAPETEARRRAFADLLAPITVPQLT